LLVTACETWRDAETVVLSRRAGAEVCLVAISHLHRRLCLDLYHVTARAVQVVLGASVEEILALQVLIPPSRGDVVSASAAE